jgi:hypothetical protein
MENNMNLFEVVVAMLLAKVRNLMVVVDKVQKYLPTLVAQVEVEVDILECLKHLLLPLQQILELKSMQF